MASHVSVANLARAPHRPMFFVGATNVLIAMIWWALWLSSTRWGVFGMPDPTPYAGYIHPFLMQYQVLPAFFFGFLLTVFPRWIGEPDVNHLTGLPVGIGIFGGQLLTLAGALGWYPGLVLGAISTLAGWLYGLRILGRYVLIDRGKTWHLNGCFGALCAGAVGIAFWLAYLLGAGDRFNELSILIGTFGLLIPVFFTVAHRMLPFFAKAALPGYVAWRPKWVLATGWSLFALHILFPATWRWVPDLFLFLLFLLLFFRWLPRRHMPPILLVLFVALTWLPIAFGLYTAQGLVYALDGSQILGKAPAHALFVGFFASTMVAMVTRVTMGHSGRAITLPAIAGLTFVLIQVVALLRIWAELSPDWGAWQAVAACGWIVAYLPWVLWAGHVYLVPRVDGKPG